MKRTGTTPAETAAAPAGSSRCHSIKHTGWNSAECSSGDGAAWLGSHRRAQLRQHRAQRCRDQRRSAWPRCRDAGAPSPTQGTGGCRSRTHGASPERSLCPSLRCRGPWARLLCQSQGCRGPHCLTDGEDAAGGVTVPGSRPRATHHPRRREPPASSPPPAPGSRSISPSGSAPRSCSCCSTGELQ